MVGEWKYLLFPTGQTLVYANTCIYICGMELVTPYKYAKLCGVTPQAIALRIAHKSLEVIEHKLPDGSVKLYIDIEANPPVKFGSDRKPEK